MLDVFQFLDKGHISALAKYHLSPPKAISLSKEKTTQDSSINILKHFLQEYKNLLPKEGGDTFLALSYIPDCYIPYSELNEYNILFYSAGMLGNASPEEARLLLESLDDNEQQETIAHGLLKGWAQTDWEGAVDYLLSHRDKDYAANAFKIMLKEHVRLNPEEAVTWLNAQSEAVRSTGLMPALKGLAEYHPERSSRFVSTTLQPGDLNDVYLLNLVSTTLPKSDWETAFKWISTMHASTRSEYASTAYDILAELDCTRATEEYHKGNRNLSYAITKILTKKSPVQAMEWVVQNMKKEKKKGNHIPMIVGDSAAQTREFAEYVNQMATGEMKDDTLAAMMRDRSRIHENSFYTIDDSLSLASGISNEITKNQAIEDSLDLWMQKNPERLRQWVETTSDLSNESKADYIQRCDSLLKKKIAR